MDAKAEGKAAGTAVQAVCDAALLSETLVAPLRHLCLKVFGDAETQRELPPDFAAQWAAITKLLQRATAQFSKAFGRMAVLTARVGLSPIVDLER